MKTLKKMKRRTIVAIWGIKLVNVVASVVVVGILSFAGSAMALDSLFPRQSAAAITDQSRNSPFGNDFIRLIYVPHGLSITTLGKPGASRAFFGNSGFYTPPLSTSQIVDLFGGATTAAFDLVAMRCQPSNMSRVDPELATWPNVAKFLLDDLTPAPSCPGSSTSDQAYCLAKNFEDTSNQPLILSLFNAISFAKDLYSINNFDGVNLLNSLYGIGNSNSGLGFSVKNSANQSFTAEQTLVNSVVPEYLLKNVTLAEASCRCVQVPAYNGRDNQPLSTTFIWNRGSLSAGACRTVKRILPF
jgi:hypothetical protein